MRFGLAAAGRGRTMPAMRVSLLARLVSHPVIDFGARRHVAERPRLGLFGTRTTYHRSRRATTSIPVSVLRPVTSRFRFPAVGRAYRLPARRQALPFGLSRGRRA